MKDSYPVIIRILSQKEILCSVCGASLTSPRSRRYGKGQRCRWKTEGGPKRKRSARVNTGMPIGDVLFTVSGNKEYVQLKIGDF
jgi:hypothetical protein